MNGKGNKIESNQKNLKKTKIIENHRPRLDSDPTKKDV